jgi:hypothetical protein
MPYKETTTMVKEKRWGGVVAPPVNSLAGPHPWEIYNI